MSTLKAAQLAIPLSVRPSLAKPAKMSVIAVSRSHNAVIELLVTLPSIDLFIKNVQGESGYDIAAEKGDLIICELIECFEKA